MNKMLLLQTIQSLLYELESFKKEVQSDFLRKTIAGEPAIIHDLQAAIIKIMMNSNLK